MSRDHRPTGVPTSLEQACATPGRHVYTYFCGACLLIARDLTGGHQLGEDEKSVHTAWSQLRLQSGLDLDTLAPDLTHLRHDPRWKSWEALDWSQVDLVALGDLVAGAKASDLRRLEGVHYSPRRELEHLVDATFLADFRETWRRIAARVSSRDDAATQQARDLLRQLAAIEILDPACGAGNILLTAYTRINELAREILAALGPLAEQPRPRISNLHGIECDPNTAAAARLLVWLCGLRWHPHDFSLVARIECCDALVVGTDKPKRTPWPRVDYILANPPFIGNKYMRMHLGSEHTQRLRGLYPELPQDIDYVMFWWHRSALHLRTGNCKRMGLITTNSVRQLQNRHVVSTHLGATEGLALTWAVPDHPWPGAANVRVSMVVGERKPGPPAAKIVSLSPASCHRVSRIHADLTGGLNLDAARPLPHNRGRIFQGMNLVGTGFRLTREQLHTLGYHPAHLPPVIRPYLNAREAMGRGPTRWVIDAYGWHCEQLKATYPKILLWLEEHVFEVRRHNRRRGYRERWWIFGEPRRALREALCQAGQTTMVVTPETSRHRLFLPIHSNICPDHTLHVLVGLDHFELGVLSSTTHQLWARRMGGRQGAGNDTRYTSSRCFLTFPWPRPAPGLRHEIAGAMADVESLRASFQTSDPTCTLSKIYRNLRTPHLHPLARAHDALDGWVRQAYGWPDNPTPDDQISRLLERNLQTLTQMS